jgi:uncharacterized peroxidase-related enzyme
MKIDSIEKRSLAGKLKLALFETVMGKDNVPDIVRLLLHRPAFFGTAFNNYCHVLLRGASHWTVGERELFAASVSRWNDCAFCSSIHTAIAARAVDRAVDTPLDALQQQDLRPAARAALVVLEKLTKTPGEVVPGDFDELRRTGVSDAAMEQVVHICSVFSSINRIADSLGFALPSATSVARSADLLLKRGYVL